MVYIAPDVQLTKIKCNTYVMEICHEIPWQIFNPDSYIYPLFTLLYFVSQVVTQVHWAVFYTYHGPVDFMHDISLFHYF